MRYKEIIDYANEPRHERLARLALMYSSEGDAEAEDAAAETALTLAQTEKLRADALAAVARVEAEYAEASLDALIPVIAARLLATPPHPDWTLDAGDEAG